MANIMCTVDWAAAGSWAQAAAGFAGVGAVIWAANKGAQSFENWLLQKQTERKLDVADRLLGVVYRLERVFPSVRSPAVLAWESEQAEQKLKQDFPDFDQYTKAEQQRFRTAQVVLLRLSGHKSDWDNLEDVTPSAKAYFGEDMKQALEKFRQALTRIQVSAQMYPKAEGDLSSKMEADFWSHWGEVAHGKDEVGDLVKTGVTDSELILLPVLRSSPKQPPHRETTKGRHPEG